MSEDAEQFLVSVDGSFLLAAAAATATATMTSSWIRQQKQMHRQTVKWNKALVATSITGAIVIAIASLLGYSSKGPVTAIENAEDKIAAAVALEDQESATPLAIAIVASLASMVAYRMLAQVELKSPREYLPAFFTSGGPKKEEEQEPKEELPVEQHGSESGNGGRSGVGSGIPTPAPRSSPKAKMQEQSPVETLSKIKTMPRHSWNEFCVSCKDFHEDGQVHHAPSDNEEGSLRSRFRQSGRETQRYSKY